MGLRWGGVNGCFKVRFTFIFEKALEVKAIKLLFHEVERVPSCNKQGMLESFECDINNTGMSWVSHCDRPPDTFQVGVVLC